MTKFNAHINQTILIMINRFLIILFAFLTFNACSVKQQEIIDTDEISESASFGAKINIDNAIETNTLLSQMEGKDSLEARVKGVIEKTCKMKGCWMTVKLNDEETMRVTFKDYGFFVPKEGMEGKEVYFEGIAKKKITPVDELKHFAKDEGKSEEEVNAIETDKEEVSFVATGVVIEGVGN